MSPTKIIASVLMAAVIASAQWVDYPTPGVPRLADGKPNLTAAAPKTPDGKPDLSGLWTTKPGYTGNLARDLKPGEVSFQPWASEVYKHRQQTQGKDDPQAYCVLSGVPREHVVPYPFKILNSQGMIVILYEALHSYRQIFMDGRKLPKDPNPTWMGYSVGHWEGDTLVVDVTGFNDKTWLGPVGTFHSEALHVTERYTRINKDRINYDVTMEDPNVFTKPWTIHSSMMLREGTRLYEYPCAENNLDPARYEKLLKDGIDITRH
jgi:hypothetical protein